MEQIQKTIYDISRTVECLLVSQFARYKGNVEQKHEPGNEFSLMIFGT